MDILTLASFQAIPVDDVTFKASGSEDSRKKNNIFLTGESSTVNYKGNNIGENHPNVILNSFCVGVIDRVEESVIIRNAPFIGVKTTSKLLDEKAEKQKTEYSSYIEAKNVLGEAFGNKRTKTQIKAYERSKIDMSTLQSSKEHIMGAVESKTANLPTAEELQKQLDEDRALPKYNATTENVEEVYLLKDIVTPREEEAIKVEYIMTLKGTDVEEYLGNEEMFHPFVAEKILIYLKSTRPVPLTLKGYLYLNYMLKFRALPDRVLQKPKELYSSSLKDVPSVVAEKFLRVFAESNKSGHTR
jgi:DNA-directed RNA polymerase I subunit RPA49